MNIDPKVLKIILKRVYKEFFNGSSMTTCRFVVIFTFALVSFLLAVPGQFAFSVDIEGDDRNKLISRSQSRDEIGGYAVGDTL